MMLYYSFLGLGTAMFKESKCRVLSQLIHKHNIWLGRGLQCTASRETWSANQGDVNYWVKLDCAYRWWSGEAERSVVIRAASLLPDVQEFPDLDVGTIAAPLSYCSTFSKIRLQVGEESMPPGAIGVGQYQHDVKVSQLSKSLANVVEGLRK